MMLGRVLEALFGRGFSEPQPARLPMPAPLDPGVDTQPCEGRAPRPLPPMQPYEVLVRDESETVGDWADTGDFLAWCAELDGVDGAALSWARLWGLYHEYCTLNRCRPRSVRRLQQDLPRYGVTKGRQMRNGKKPTLYTLPIVSAAERKVA
jgi:hypothetical protein